jgi:hypothetical protein
MDQLLFHHYMDIKEILKNKKLTIMFTLAGALGGFLYWRYIGCLSGTCVIRSVWYWSTLWGTAVGYLVGDMINDFVIKRKNQAEERK